MQATTSLQEHEAEVEAVDVAESLSLAEYNELDVILPGPYQVGYGDEAVVYHFNVSDFVADSEFSGTARVRMDDQTIRFADIIEMRTSDRTADNPDPILWVKVRWSYYTLEQWFKLEEDLPHKKDIKRSGITGGRELIKLLTEQSDVEIIDFRALESPVQVEFFDRDNPYQLEVDFEDDSTMFYRAEYDKRARKWSKKPWARECITCRGPYRPESTKDADIMHFCPQCSQWYHRDCRLRVSQGPGRKRALDTDERGKQLEKSLLPPAKRRRKEICNEPIPDTLRSLPREAVDPDFVRMARQSIIRGGDRHGFIGSGAAVVKSRDILDMALAGECTPAFVTRQSGTFEERICQRPQDGLELPGGPINGITIYCPKGHPL